MVIRGKLKVKDSKHIVVSDIRGNGSYHVKVSKKSLKDALREFNEGDYISAKCIGKAGAYKDAKGITHYNNQLTAIEIGLVTRKYK